MKITTIAATQQNPPSGGVLITLENSGALLGIVVSLIAIGTVATKIISRINKISVSIEQIEKTLSEQAAYSKKIEKLDRDVELHIQEYVNRKDVVQMLLGQLNEKIDHKFRRVLFYSRDIQKYLARSTDFKIREYEETTQSPED